MDKVLGTVPDLMSLSHSVTTSPMGNAGMPAMDAGEGNAVWVGAAAGAGAVVFLSLCFDFD